MLSDSERMRPLPLRTAVTTVIFNLAVAVAAVNSFQATWFFNCHVFHKIMTSIDQQSQISSKSVYRFAPDSPSVGGREELLSLRDVFVLLWSGKWCILITSMIFAVASITYALLATEWYRADVLLVPANENAPIAVGGQLGGLAALAGVSVGGESTVEAIATLKSREFARSFIEDHSLVQVFFEEEWIASERRWRDRDPAKWPDIRDAVEYFHDEILRVSEDRQTGLVRLAVEWTDPALSALWANDLAGRLNARLRERALHSTGANVEYLKNELAETSLVSMQLTIGRLLEGELQKLMLARGNEEFAFKIIDVAEIPRRPARPERAMIVVVGTFLGGLLGLLMVVLQRPADGSNLCSGKPLPRQSVS